MNHSNYPQFSSTVIPLALGVPETPSIYPQDRQNHEMLTPYIIHKQAKILTVASDNPTVMVPHCSTSGVRCPLSVPNSRQAAYPTKRTEAPESEGAPVHVARW